MGKGGMRRGNPREAVAGWLNDHRPVKSHVASTDEIVDVRRWRSEGGTTSVGVTRRRSKKSGSLDS